VQIPDIPDTEAEKSRFAKFETDALKLFADEMSQMSVYTSEHHVAPKAQQAAAKKAQIRGALAATVGNSSTFVRFFWMWCVIQLFLGTAVPVCVVIGKNVKLDSTLIALLIGSPLAIAAALTAIPVSSRSNENVLKESVSDK